ncbi:MAG: thiolase family protein [Myxococcales bacterium]|nr:thiolase family protein [Myxococcales bacterium]
MRQNIMICATARTAIGNYSGALARVPAVNLGAHVIAEVLRRAELDASAVDECFMGCVLTGGMGQAPARQAWLRAGGPNSVPCTTVSKVCGSGLQAVVEAARGVQLGEFQVAVAGGMENMSAAGRFLPPGCNTIEEAIDIVVHDGLWDVYSDKHMGTICDELAAAEGLSREEQDSFAIRSYRRAIDASQEGLTAWEIHPIDAPNAEGTVQRFAIDEAPRSFREDKIPHIRPAFVRDGSGTITAANASSINDGAAALVLASEDAVARYGLTPLARIVSWGSGAVAPEKYPYGPVEAARNALAKANLNIADIDYWEINEAFAVVGLLVMRQLGLTPEQVNLLGGAVAIGHPIGASGARVLGTLINVLRLQSGRYGAATLCIGGGEGIAMIIERLS